MSKKAKAHNWASVAAQNILSDLSGRSGIGNELDACDDGIKQEIAKSIEAIIDKAHYEATLDANTNYP